MEKMRERQRFNVFRQQKEHQQGIERPESSGPFIGRQDRFTGSAGSQMKSRLKQRVAGRRRRFNCIEKGGSGGFTLVELIVVLLVLGIMCTIAVMGMIGWKDYADFKKNNEYAQNIFVAAQIQLTQYAERGQLTLLQREISLDGTAPEVDYLLSKQGTLTGADGSAYSADGGTLWENNRDSEDARSDKAYYLCVEKGDYNIYLELKGKPVSVMRAKTAKERRIKVLYDLIQPYIADKSILDAAICIEFDADPNVALIYSVFYNDKASGFSYAEGEGTVSIRERSQQGRKKEKTGYYGLMYWHGESTLVRCAQS